MRSMNAEKRAASLTTLMLTQDYNPNHWEWSEDERRALGSAKATGKIILDKLLAAGIEVSEAYAISHDKDEKEMWKFYESPHRKDLVANHIHFVCKMTDGATLERLADIIGVAPQSIEKPRSGRYAYNNMLAYLIHIKYAQKYQYSPVDVQTLLGRDYLNYYEEYHVKWERARANRIQKTAKISLKELEILIIDGVVTKEDLLFKSEYKYIYAIHKARIDKILSNVEKINRDRAISREGLANYVNREMEKMMHDQSTKNSD